MAGDKDIRDKLAKLEALFARGATAGERAAAGAARDSLQARLGPELYGSEENETEMQYSLPDVWSVRIFVALCRKHGNPPLPVSPATTHDGDGPGTAIELRANRR